MTTVNAGRLAVALDDLLTDPTAAGLLAEAWEALPVGWRDQVAAADRDLNARAERAAAAFGMSHGRARPTDVPEWLRLGAGAALLAWTVGQGGTCLHDPQPTSAPMVTAAAWRPGLVTCGACSHLFALRPGSVADRTCDGCGFVTNGVEHDDGIRPSVLMFGRLAYLHGTCSGCEYGAAEGAR